MYQGHHRDGSSVQNHSAGSYYPFVVQVRETCGGTLGHAEVLDPSGRVRCSVAYPCLVREQRLNAYGLAIAAAEQLAAHFRA